MKSTYYRHYGGEQADLQTWLRENAADNSDRLERLRRNLRLAREQELTPLQRQMLEMHFEGGKSMADIARTLGVNRSTVSRTIARAKRRLFHCLRYGL